MRQVFRLSVLGYGFIFLVLFGCSPRSYMHYGYVGHQGLESKSTHDFTAPSAVGYRTQAPQNVDVPRADQMYSENYSTPAVVPVPQSQVSARSASSQAVQVPLTPQNTSYSATIKTQKEMVPVSTDLLEKEKQYINFTSYNPFAELGSDYFYLDLAVAAQGFIFPINGELSSQYGMRNGRPHHGIDLRAPKGTPIHSVFDGVVRLSRYYAGYGNVIVVRHYNGLETAYSHNDKNLVKVGDVVQSGDVIAECGRTGQTTGNHLHFEIRVNGVPINPNLILDVQTKGIQNGVLKITRQGGSVTANLQVNQAPRIEDIDSQGQTFSEGVTTAPTHVQSKGMKMGDTVMQAPAPQPVYHTIVSGETLSHLAHRYHTTVAKIMEMNQIQHAQYVRIGQKLRVK